MKDIRFSIDRSDKCYMCGSQATMVVAVDSGGARGVICGECAEKYNLTQLVPERKQKKEKISQEKLL